jgi:transcriptional regulator with XRE-family HTH domain
MIVEMNVSDNIREIRKGKGLTQAEVARRYGTSPEFYHRLEKKGHSLTLEQIEKLAQALDVTIFEILGTGNVVTGNSDAGNRERIATLEKEIFDLKAENKMYLKHNRILFKNIEFLQTVIDTVMQNEQSMQKFKEQITRGDETVEEQIRESASTLFPDLIKQLNIMKDGKPSD